MPFSAAEIDNLAIGQLSAEEIARAIVAFDGFEQVFGSEWITDFFKGARAPGFVSHVRSLWEDWVLIRPMPHSEQLSQRWSGGIGQAGVKAEVKVIAYLKRESNGVELFPVIGSGKVPECRFLAGESWVYAEVSQRGISEVRRRGQRALTRLAESAARAIPGHHGKLAVRRIPTEEDADRILSWLEKLTSPAESHFEDLAVFFGDPLESPTGMGDRIAQVIPRPHLFASHATAELKGTACISISDDSAQTVLETEASQLPSNAPGMIFLDITSVIGSYEEWAPLIQRRLQPTINTRIGGVVLYQTLNGIHGPTMAGTFLLNPFAKNPLPEAAVQLARGFCQKVD